VSWREDSLSVLYVQEIQSVWDFAAVDFGADAWVAIGKYPHHLSSFIYVGVEAQPLDQFPVALN